MMSVSNSRGMNQTLNYSGQKRISLLLLAIHIPKSAKDLRLNKRRSKIIQKWIQQKMANYCN